MSIDIMLLRKCKQSFLVAYVYITFRGIETMKKVVEKLESTPGYKRKPDPTRRKIQTNRAQRTYRAEQNVLYPTLPPTVPPPDYYEVVPECNRPKTERDTNQRLRTKLPIGISVSKNGKHGVMSVIMEAKTPLDPTPKKVKRYTTSIDNQKIVTIEVSYCSKTFHY